MKKLFLICAMLASSLGLSAGLYVPAAGPVQLGDVVAGGVVRGAIMKAVIDHNPINPNAHPTLAAANAAIAVFDGQGQNFRAYQTIVTNIGQSINTQDAINAVKAFESVIMHLYDYDMYLIGGYKPGVSMFFTGVRWSWINPLAYVSPKSYFSDNDARAKQLIDELDKLAEAVKIHSGFEYARIKATVHSYRHWRRNMMLAVAAYLAADAYKHGYNDSIVNQFYQGGLENAGEMMINHIDNVGRGLALCGKGVSKCAQGVWNVGCKVGDFVLHGKKAFAKKNVQLQSEQNDKKDVQKSIIKRIPIIGKLSENMTDFEQTRFDAFDKEAQKIDEKKQPEVLTPRKEVWKSVKSAVVNAVGFEIDAREKRKEIWNGRLARMKNLWNGDSAKNPVSQPSVVVSPVVKIEKQTVHEQPKVQLTPVKAPVVTSQPQKNTSDELSKELSSREKLKNRLNVLANLVTGQDEKNLVQKQVNLIKQVKQGCVQNLKALPGKIKQHIQDSDIS